jgi:hypothetical protein
MQALQTVFPTRRSATAYLALGLWGGKAHHALADTPSSKNRPYVPAATTRIAYEVDGQMGGSALSGDAELRWAQDGKTYEAQLLIRKFGLTLQAWTSQGRLTDQGLVPELFSGKRWGQAETQARFDHTGQRVQFSAGTPDVPLRPGAQDQLSVFMQLAAMTAGSPTAMAPGRVIAMQAIGDRYAEAWTFHVADTDTLRLAGRTVRATGFVHQPTPERQQKLEVWVAPDPHFVPVKIRITEANGDFLNLWRTNPSNR